MMVTLDWPQRGKILKVKYRIFNTADELAHIGSPRLEQALEEVYTFEAGAPC